MRKKFGFLHKSVDTRIKMRYYMRMKRALFGKKRVKDEVVLTYDDFQRAISTANTHTASNLSAVYQCVEMISNTISKLPFFVINRKTNKHEEKSGMYLLLNMQPNAKMCASVFKKTLVRDLLLTGNAYILPRFMWRSSVVKSLEYIDSRNVNVEETKDDVIYTVNDRFGGEPRKYRYDEIIHVKINADEGIKGCSVLEFAKLAVSVGLSQEEYQEDFYKNGGQPYGVLATSADLSQKKATVMKPDGTSETVSLKDVIRNEWKKAHSGIASRFNVAVLDNGMEYKTVPQISPADMDFVSAKTTNIEDIARFFNVPLHKLGVGKQTYNNNEAGNIEYMTNCIIPLVTQIEQALTTKLLFIDEIDKGYEIKANIEAELRGDSAARASWYEKMQQCGVYTINDIREREDMELLAEEIGDARLVGPNKTPLNLLLKGKIVEETTAKATKTEETDDDKVLQK